jgi:hypothetical protein
LFLKRGTTIAVFHSLGIVCKSIQQLKILANTSDSVDLLFLKIFIGIFEIPGEPLLSKLFIKSRTDSAFI